MRRLIAGLMLGMLFACGCGDDPKADEQLAQDYILQRYKVELVGDGTGPVHVKWHYDHPCIDVILPPWGKPEAHADRCRTGRAWATGPTGCWIEVVWGPMAVSIGDTSYAHELLHCVLWQDIGDPGHEHPAWNELLPKVNAELRELGL